MAHDTDFCRRLMVVAAFDGATCVFLVAIIAIDLYFAFVLHSIVNAILAVLGAIALAVLRWSMVRLWEAL